MKLNPGDEFFPVRNMFSFYCKNLLCSYQNKPIFAFQRVDQIAAL